MQFHKDMWWKNKEEITLLFQVNLDIHFSLSRILNFS